MTETVNMAVDHILPESRGGKTADHNLICCHILTNDEKADRFPCFNANGRNFEIQKRQNHYEIISKTYIEEDDAEEDAVNFFDVSQGLRLWKQCWDNGQECFVGYVKIRVTVPVGEEKLFERYRQFISELFCTDFIFQNSVLRIMLASVKLYNKPCF